MAQDDEVLQLANHTIRQSYHASTSTTYITLTGRTVQYALSNIGYAVVPRDRIHF